MKEYQSIGLITACIARALGKVLDETYAPVRDTSLRCPSKTESGINLTVYDPLSDPQTILKMEDDFIPRIRSLLYSSTSFNFKRIDCSIVTVNYGFGIETEIRWGFGGLIKK